MAIVMTLRMNLMMKVLNKLEIIDTYRCNKQIKETNHPSIRIYRIHNPILQIEQKRKNSRNLKVEFFFMRK